ncbi:alpha-1,4-glucan--maltose-1-phosphate maltosyltransferase [Micrococcoides hystricis]|uniref:Alpha-1,4-glucan:maltose-1-phosphate maltosyltransferase n=1 Tax=Micrococcoides hystricis TaxID=1572761 RepID=A0ABV6PB20_9MICC
MNATHNLAPRPYPDLKTGRIVVTNVSPVIDCGAFPAKAAPNEDITISAVVFREGHEKVAATAVLFDAAGARIQEKTMTPGAPGTDLFHATLRPPAVGEYTFCVEGWADSVATWAHAAEVKIAAGVDSELMLAEGANLFEAVAADRKNSRKEGKVFTELVELLRGKDLPVAQRLAATQNPTIKNALDEEPYRELVSASPAYPIQVQRELAHRGAWYEFFPRSIGASYDAATGEWASGTFKTAQKRLPEVAAMGFDVVYLPPIHPIGVTHRKGPNNTLTAGPQDPGSPWAIGAKEGGHEAVHPELGTVQDFIDFVEVANQNNLEIALDLALQCSPDHPWVAKHPDWFTIQADGTIAYAENPPKKYQDIYPLNFDNDPKVLSKAILKIVLLWVSRGVKIFRVDNPHTKPVWFWEWLIRETHKKHPEVVFLAEAFTRPAMMHTLAKVGFQQSYGYFTWRNTKEEIEEYLAEITQETQALYRPNFFVNTPDILTEYLQFGGPAAFKVRAVLAAMSNPLWGVYSGFELFEHVARPGAEEYIDNEKYEFKPRDYQAAEAEGKSMAPMLARLNWIRRNHPATEDLGNMTIHESSDDATVVFSKTKVTADGTDTLITVLNTDPQAVREGTVWLDLDALGLAEGKARFQVEDLLSGEVYDWGEENYFRLDPWKNVAHILHVKH